MAEVIFLAIIGEAAASVVDTIFFDFFGTLVSYSHSRREQDYSTSHGYLEANMAPMGYEQYLESWDEAFCFLENESQKTLVEFSLHQVMNEFLVRNEDAELTDEKISAFIDLFLSEWCTEIRPVAGLKDTLNALSSRYKLAVVSNAHHKPLVPGLITQFGLATYFEAVITSIDHGKPKPHESIYKKALAKLETQPESAIFVGDSYQHDYLAPRLLGFQSFLISKNPPESMPKEHILSHVNEILSHVP